MIFETYAALVRAHPITSAMVQFALLGTLGELASRWVSARRLHWPFTARTAALKALGWAALAVCIKYAFSGFTAFVEGLVSHGLLPRLGAFGTALAVSVSMNLQFGPFLVIVHRLIDNAIDGTANWARLDKALITLLWFWIPAHTATFLLPPDFRVGLAALWSLALGVLLGFYARPARPLRLRRPLCAAVFFAASWAAAEPAPPQNLGVFAPSRLKSVLGQDGVTPMPVRTPDGRALLLWTFGDTILGGWKGPVATTATVNFGDAADMKAMPPNTAAWTAVPSSAAGLAALDFKFFTEGGEVSQPVPYLEGEDPFVKRLWAAGGAQVKNTAYVYYMDIDLEREKGPLAFRPRGTGLAKARIGEDFPEGGLSFERVKGFSLPGVIAGDGVVARRGRLYLAARAARAGDENFDALCFLRVKASRVEDPAAYEYLRPSGRWGKGPPALLFDDMGGEVSLSWDEPRKEYSVFYMSSREQAVKFMSFRDFKSLPRGAAARAVYSPPAKPGRLYYSAKEVWRDEDAVHVIYMDPSIYQPILVSFSRAGLYP